MKARLELDHGMFEAFVLPPGARLFAPPDQMNCWFVMVLDPNRSREVTWLLDSPTTIAEVEKTTRQALAKLRG